MKKSVLALAVVLGAAVPVAASAADAPAAAPAAAAAPSVGAKVFDPQGAEVGTIASVDGAMVVIDTGKVKATVEGKSLAAGAAGLTIAFTRAQLEAAVEQANAQAAAAFDAALVAGATVGTSDGVAVGTVKEVNAQGNVVIEREGAAPVALPKDVLVLKDGALSLLFTKAQFDKAVGAAVAETVAAPAPATGTR